VFRLLVANLICSQRRWVAFCVYCSFCCFWLASSPIRSYMQIIPTQVSSFGPVQDVLPLTMYQDGVYVSGELWEYWCETFPRPFVKCLPS
jgi:hypothetical protein